MYIILSHLKYFINTVDSLTQLAFNFMQCPHSCFNICPNTLIWNVRCPSLAHTSYQLIFNWHSHLSMFVVFSNQFKILRCFFLRRTKLLLFSLSTNHPVKRLLKLLVMRLCRILNKESPQLV